jgi:hypothetical protein
MGLWKKFVIFGITHTIIRMFPTIKPRTNKRTDNTGIILLDTYG